MATPKQEREAFDFQKKEYTVPCERGEICFIHCLWRVKLTSILCKYISLIKTKKGSSY